MKKTLGLLAVLIGLVAVAAMQGCSLFDSGSVTATIKGSPGSECSVNSECQSNDCRYPGLCQ